MMYYRLLFFEILSPIQPRTKKRKPQTREELVKRLREIANYPEVVLAEHDIRFDFTAGDDLWRPQLSA